jgi:NAD(P)-dependent dehydrogenase (short-subunit alcohol dehydrogenase family)
MIDVLFRRTGHGFTPTTQEEPAMDRRVAIITGGAQDIGAGLVAAYLGRGRGHQVAGGRVRRARHPGQRRVNAGSTPGRHAARGTRHETGLPPRSGALNPGFHRVTAWIRNQGAVARFFFCDQSPVCQAKYAILGDP